MDLNRNFLSEDEFAALRARDPNYVGYVNLNSLFNPVKTISTNIHVNEVYSLLRTAYALGRYGLLHIKRALVAGNYHKMDGVGFGGFDRVDEILLKRSLLRNDVDQMCLRRLQSDQQL